MSSTKSRSRHDIKIQRPTSRIGKLAVIRETFATQPLGGWDASEQNDYLRRIGLEPVTKNKPRSDEEIDFILADLERLKMVLFK